MKNSYTESLAHTTWECKYHIVFAPKYRRQEIYGELKQEIGMIIRTLCERKEVTIIEAEVFFLMGTFLVPGPNWLVMLVLLSPSVSLIAVTLIVRSSAKAQSMEESQQSAVFLILPLVLLIVGQVSGLMLVSPWILLALSLVCMGIAWVLLKRAVKGFVYERLLG